MNMHQLIRSAGIVLGTLAVGCTGAGGGNASTETSDQPPRNREPSGPLPATFAGVVVFARAQGGANVIMFRNADGSDPTSLGAQGFSPAVSPDGKQVAYNTPEQGLAVFDLGTKRETIVAGPLAVAPRWSPDGHRILFWSDRGGTSELWTMRPDGTEPAQLTTGDGHKEGDWSPDGRRLVFRMARPGSGGGDIWLIDADGSNSRELFAGERMDSDPSWSPDGRRIAFVRVVPRTGGGTISQIYVMDADGGNVTRVTSDGADDWKPRWAPDGSRIVFFGFHTGADDPDLFTISPDGSGLAVLLGGPTYDHGAVYGPR